MNEVKFLNRVRDFLTIISNLEEVSVQILKALQSETLKGKKIEDFYNPKPKDVKNLSLKDIIKRNNIDLKGVSLSKIKSKLEGRVIRVLAKFPSKVSTSYGLLRTSIHFKGDKISFGDSTFNYTAGDPNLWPRFQGEF